MCVCIMLLCGILIATLVSYTNFTLSSSKLSVISGSYSPSNTTASGKNAPGGHSKLYEYIFQMDASVENKGKVDGAEVAQVYVGYPESAGEPPKQLRGFQKVSVGQGSSKQVSIKIRRKDVSIWDVVSQSWVVPQGDYAFYLGTSSRKIAATSKASYDGKAWSVSA